MNPALQGYTAAVAEAAGPAALGGLAADLEAIEQLVLANPQLRAALTDTAVPGPARRAVVLDLLDGKVTPAARRLAAFASRRSSRARGPRRARLGQHPGPPPRPRARTRSRA